MKIRLKLAGISGVIQMSKDYKVETFIQTLHSGQKRVVVSLFETTKKLVKRYYIDIKEDEFRE